MHERCVDNRFTHLAYKRNEELVVSVNSNVWNVEWPYVFRADMGSSVSYMLAFWIWIMRSALADVLRRIYEFDNL